MPEEVKPTPTFDEMLEHHKAGLAGSMLNQLRQLRLVASTTILTPDQRATLMSEAVHLAQTFDQQEGE